MEMLNRLLRYNSWANAKLFTLCTEVDPALLTEGAGGTIGSLLATIAHYTGVEDFYLAMLRGVNMATDSASREEYVQNDLPFYAERSAAIAAGYPALAAEQGEAVFAREIHLPWFPRPLGGADALAQVLTHSAQHRAQVLSRLGERGVKVPDIDYIFMLAES
jgi:uncharacterized damage-inducible protein DinB